MTSTLLNQDNAVLLIIDIQEKLLKVQPKAETIVKKAAILAKAAQILKIPVIVTKQYPQGLGFTHPDIKANLDEAVIILEKTSFSCVRQENFMEVLKKLNKKQVIVCGIETHVCVHQSVNDLLKEKFEVYIAQDAVGSRNTFEHKLGIQRMLNDGAIPTCVEMVLFELLQQAKHPHFKEIQALIK
jgi:nicotinamidase-related amidase